MPYTICKRERSIMNEKEILREKKLNELQEAHRLLSIDKRKKKKVLTELTGEIAQMNKELDRLGQQIFDLKNIDDKAPHITDHAVVRYLERVKGVNIWDIKAEIMQNKDAVRVDNTIVTVNGNGK